MIYIDIQQEQIPSTSSLCDAEVRRPHVTFYLLLSVVILQHERYFSFATPIGKAALHVAW